MGCQSSKKLIVDQLNSTNDSLQSDLVKLTEEKIKICQELNKFSYEDAMIGRDIIELKLSMAENIDCTQSIIQEIKSLPRLKGEVNENKETHSISIATSYYEIFSKLEALNDLLGSKFLLKSQLKKYEKEVLDAEENNKKMIECYEINSQFLNNEEAYNHEYHLLQEHIKDLEEELDEYTCSSSILKVSKNKIEAKVHELSDQQAIVELGRVQRKIKTLEEAIEYQKKISNHSINNVLNPNDKQNIILKQYNSMIKEQKLRIESLKYEYVEIKAEIQRIQNQYFESYANDDKLNMINSIIDRCRGSSPSEKNMNLKRLIKKKTLISSIENTVSKAREAAKNDIN